MQQKMQTPEGVRRERWRIAKEIGKKVPLWLAVIGIGLGVLAGGIALCVFTFCTATAASVGSFFLGMFGIFGLGLAGIIIGGFSISRRNTSHVRHERRWILVEEVLAEEDRE